MNKKTIEDIAVAGKKVLVRCDFNVPLDENKNILAQEYDDNPFDYEYFEKKFEECIVEKGMIYELETVESLKKLTSDFNPEPKTTCYFQVEGHDVSFSDKLVATDMFFFKDYMKEKLIAIGAKKVVFTFSTNRWNLPFPYFEIHNEYNSFFQLHLPQNTFLFSRIWFYFYFLYTSLPFIYVL